MIFSDIKSLGTKKLEASVVSIKAQTQASFSHSEAVEAELAKGFDLSIVVLVDALIKSAHAARASDIHLDPLIDGLKARLRVDGVPQDAHLLPQAIQNEVISRLKILCGLRT